MSTARIDRIMEQASQALVACDYIKCESACLQAMQLAKESGEFERYARILLPLQEARRQRRQSATDAGVFILTGKRLQPNTILRRHRAGCLLLTDPPYSLEDEQQLRHLAARRRRFIEVQRLSQNQLRSLYLTAMEDQGDAALTQIPADLPPARQIDALEQILLTTADHEITHQQLAAAARRAATAPTA